MATLSEGTVKSIKESAIFPELKAWLIEVMEELNSVEDLDRMTNEKAGEEAKIRLKTISKLKEILKPFIDYKEKWEPSAEELKVAKSKYGM